MPKCILIVDDSAIMRRTLRKLFEAIPEWEVCGEAENGRDGLKQAAKLNPDLVVLDLSMPVMNGFEATRELRRSKMPRIPIIALTASAMRSDHDECLDSGMDDYLSKPVKPDHLAAAIKRWAGSPSPATED